MDVGCRATELAMALLDRVVHKTALLPGAEQKWAFLIRQQIEEAIAVAVAEERQKLDSSQHQAEVWEGKYKMMVKEVQDLRRLMGHWSTVELALKAQEETKLQVGELKKDVERWQRNTQGAQDELITAMEGQYRAERQAESFRKALEEIKAKLERSHDGGCILPLRDMVNDALGEGVAVTRLQSKIDTKLAAEIEAQFPDVAAGVPDKRNEEIGAAYGEVCPGCGLLARITCRCA